MESDTVKAVAEEVYDALFPAIASLALRYNIIVHKSTLLVTFEQSVIEVQVRPGRANGSLIDPSCPPGLKDTATEDVQAKVPAGVKVGQA